MSADKLTPAVVGAAMAVDPEGFIGVRVRDLWELYEKIRDLREALRVEEADADRYYSELHDARLLLGQLKYEFDPHAEPGVSWRRRIDAALAPQAAPVNHPSHEGSETTGETEQQSGPKGELSGSNHQSKSRDQP